MAVPSFPAFHVTGPVHHFVRVPGDSGIYYVGTAEVTPTVENEKYYADTMNDVSGRRLPGQKTRQGQASVVGVQLSKYSKPAYDRVLRFDANLDIAPGWESRWSRGALVFGQDTFELWQFFEFYSAPPSFNGGFVIEPGIYWPQATLVKHDRPKLGSDTEALLLVFDMQPLYVPQANSSAVTGNERSWFLYTKDPTHPAWSQNLASLVPQ